MKLSEQPRNLATYICQHVFENSRSMDYVSYMEDGDLFISCCGNDHDFTNPAELRVVGLGHLLNRDQSLCELPDLQRGAWAERESPNYPWVVTNNQTDPQQD